MPDCQLSRRVPVSSSIQNNFAKLIGGQNFFLNLFMDFYNDFLSRISCSSYNCSGGNSLKGFFFHLYRFLKLTRKCIDKAISCLWDKLVRM